MAIDRGAESAFNTQLRSFLASIEDYALVRSFACAYSHFCRLGFLYFVWLYLFYQYPISILVFIAYIFLGPFEWAIIIVNWIIRIGTPANYTLKKSCELDPKVSNFRVHMSVTID